MNCSWDKSLRPVLLCKLFRELLSCRDKSHGLVPSCVDNDISRNVDIKKFKINIRYIPTLQSRSFLSTLQQHFGFFGVMVNVSFASFASVMSVERKTKHKFKLYTVNARFKKRAHEFFPLKRRSIKLHILTELDSKTF